MNIYNLKQKVKNITLLSNVYYTVDNQISKLKHKKKVKNFRKNGCDAAKKIVQAMNETNFQFFITYGTLLGIVRDNKFMQHDDDLDFGILESDNFSWSEIDKIMNKYNITLLHEFIYKDKVVERTYVTQSNISIDFFLYNKILDKQEVYFFLRKKGEVYKSPNIFTAWKMIPPTIEKINYKNVYNCNFPIPSNYEDILQYAYGPNWKIPDPTWVDDGYNYIECEEYGYLNICNQKEK